MDTDVSLISTDATSIVVRSILAMADGERAEFDSLYHPNAVDRENRVQPPASRVPGPAGFYSTALWLRAPFVLYTAQGDVEAAFPPTGKSFAMTQSHWFRVADGKILEHWANRDDLGHAQQLGWLPPTPGYLIRMARAKRWAKRQRSS